VPCFYVRHLTFAPTALSLHLKVVRELKDEKRKRWKLEDSLNDAQTEAVSPFVPFWAHIVCFLCVTGRGISRLLSQHLEGTPLGIAGSI
jgi:hypothetical protein